MWVPIPSSIQAFAQEGYDEESGYDQTDSGENQTSAGDSNDDAEYGYEEDQYSGNESSTEAGEDYIDATPFDDSVVITEEDIVTLNVLANDRTLFGWDKPVELYEVSQASFGSLVVNFDNTVTYTPFQVQLPPGYEKVEKLLYSATTDNGYSYYNGTINIWIQQTNDVPVAASAEYTVDENDQIDFDLYAFDEDNDYLTFILVSNATLGDTMLDPETGYMIYIPFEDFAGEDAFAYQVSDGMSTSTVETITITIEDSGVNEPNGQELDSGGSIDDQGSGNSTGENEEPFADAGDDLTVLAGNPVTLNGSDSFDPDQDTITYSWSQESGPDVSLDDPESATPAFTPPVTISTTTTMQFALVVSDGELDSDPSFATVTVIPVPVVLIDIIPNQHPNEIDLDEPDASIPVAIFGNDSLDVSFVDEDELRFGPDLAEPQALELGDINSDGFSDLISYYRIGDLGLQSGDTSACLSGSVQMPTGDEILFTKCKGIETIN